MQQEQRRPFMPHVGMRRRESDGVQQRGSENGVRCAVDVEIDRGRRLCARSHRDDFVTLDLTVIAVMMMG